MLGKKIKSSILLTSLSSECHSSWKNLQWWQRPGKQPALVTGKKQNLQHLNSFFQTVPESQETSEQFLKNFFSVLIEFSNDFIETAFTCSILLSTTSIQALLSEVLLTEMSSTRLKGWAEKEALSHFPYWDFLIFYIFAVLKFFRQTRRCVCIFCVVSEISKLLCHRSLLPRAKMKCVANTMFPAAFWIFQTMCQAQQLM